jgi:hypothetical protein
MKENHNASLVAQLNRLKADLEPLSFPESKAPFLRSLEDLIARLSYIRAQLTSASVETELSQIQRPLEQVINFLEFAKANKVLGPLLSQALHGKSPKPKKTPVEIPADLTSDRIRALLAENLSRQELKAIAIQRGISVENTNNEGIKRAILRNLERQEGYQRLTTP